jgi:hypothetical protein
LKVDACARFSAERGLRGREAQLHEPARRVVDEDEEHAGRAPILEPRILRAIDLDELTDARAPSPGLVHAAVAELARHPQLRLDHPAPQRRHRRLTVTAARTTTFVFPARECWDRVFIRR